MLTTKMLFAKSRPPYKRDSWINIDKLLRNGLDKNDSTERQRTCWNAKKELTFLLSVLTSD